mmetsp:Transcript_35527/g.83537  ORF Transcript_35527/g.83537 Transcript_35527/m.83537 type:complete len:142 (-) Transcript_35527:26-451(-)
MCIYQSYYKRTDKFLAKSLNLPEEHPVGSCYIIPCFEPPRLSRSFFARKIKNNSGVSRTAKFRWRKALRYAIQEATARRELESRALGSSGALGGSPPIKTGNSQAAPESGRGTGPAGRVRGADPPVSALGQARASQDNLLR